MTPESRKRKLQPLQASATKHEAKRIKKLPVTFMQLPLELRQRVYDFYLRDFNSSHRDPGDSHCMLRQNLGSTADLYRPLAQYRESLDFGSTRRRWGKGSRYLALATSAMPLLQLPELTTEINNYYFRYKLAVEIGVQKFFVGWLRGELDGTCKSLLRLEVCAQGHLDDYTSGLPHHQGFLQFGPVVLLKITESGHNFEIRSKWKPNRRSETIWAAALQKQALKCEEAKQEVFDGEHLVAVLGDVAREAIFRGVFEPPPGVTSADMESCIRGTRYEHVICSITLPHKN